MSGDSAPVRTRRTIVGEGHFPISLCVSPSEPNVIVSAGSCGNKQVVAWPAVSTEATDESFAPTSVMDGHQKTITTVVVSPHNAEIVASGSDDSTVRVWNKSTGALIHTLEGHSDWVKSVRFHPHNPDLLASCSFDGSVRLWNISTGEAISTLPLAAKPQWIKGVEFLEGHPDFIISLVWDSGLVIWHNPNMANPTAMDTDESGFTALFKSEDLENGLIKGATAISVRRSFRDPNQYTICVTGHKGSPKEQMLVHFNLSIGPVSEGVPDVKLELRHIFPNLAPRLLNSVNISPFNDDIVATSCDDNHIRVFSLSKKAELQKFSKTLPVTKCFFSLTEPFILYSSCPGLHELDAWDVSPSVLDQFVGASSFWDAADASSLHPKLKAKVLDLAAALRRKVASQCMLQVLRMLPRDWAIIPEELDVGSYCTGA